MANGFPLGPLPAGSLDINQLDRAYLPPTDPLLAPADRSRIYRDAPVSVVTDWTIALIKQALQQHVNGHFTASARLVESVMADPRVQATLLARTQALFGQPFRIKAADESAAAVKCRDAFDEAWPRIAPTSVLSQMIRWDALLGFSLNELVWDTSGYQDGLWIPYIKPWHPQYIYYNLVSRHYHAVSLDGLLEVTPGDSKWLLHASHGAYRGWINGAIRALATPWLVRQFALRDWARYSEVHGNPIVKAIVPTNGDSEQKRRFVEGVRVLGSDAAAELPQDGDGRGYDLQLLEAVGDTWEAFNALIERCDTAIVLALLGQNLTTEVKEGSFAAARVHGDVRQNVLEGDARALELTLHEQLARPFAQFNFGDPDLAPHLEWRVEPVEDKLQRAQALSQLATAVKTLGESGASLDWERLAKQFALPIASPELKPAPAPAAPAPGNEPSPEKESK